ncbi:MAG: hypothetical protein JXR83_10555, partial [Deltaproteobacteria bacterium]|nr:hypothetical protein [Deltaproteobacteria bacterium]
MRKLMTVGTRWPIRGQRRRCSLLVALAASGIAAVAAGHGFEVDGIATEWLDRGPPADNLGLIARDAAGEGEFIWRDRVGDERTDLARPDGELDLVEVRVAGGRALGQPGLGILIRTHAAPGPDAQFQIAIDLDRGLGSGRAWLVAEADTRVAEDARWEHLLQTRFGECPDAVCSARIWHATGFSFDDTALASRGEDGIEVFVPWSSLDLGAPPQHPLRFTVASLRADLDQRTVDLGGPDVSNAIDVVSDGGRPAAARVNTWTEVADQCIDHHFDVFFDRADGEVYPPLLIDRLVTDRSPGGGGPWIAVFNQSPLELLLEGYQIGDEETVGGDEGMARFPISTIRSLDRAVVAWRASRFRSAFGRRPDFELMGSDPAVPNLAAVPSWASGAVELSSAGDEVLLLDRWNTIVDAVSYGEGRFSGVVPHTPPGRGRLLLR